MDSDGWGMTRLLKLERLLDAFVGAPGSLGRSWSSPSAWIGLVGTKRLISHGEKALKINNSHVFHSFKVNILKTNILINKNK